MFTKRPLRTSLRMLLAINSLQLIAGAAWSSEHTDLKIRQSAKELQAACDSKRLELKKEFLAKAISPLKEEADSVLRFATQEERIRLAELARRSRNPSVAAEGTKILHTILNRAGNSEGQVLPGISAPALVVTGPEIPWGSKKVRAQIRWTGGTYEYALISPFSQNSPQEVIESRLDMECRVFLTGWDLARFYSFPSDLPAPDHLRHPATAARAEVAPEYLDFRLALQPLDSFQAPYPGAAVTESNVKGNPEPSGSDAHAMAEPSARGASLR